jgi:hypothetical protein
MHPFVRVPVFWSAIVVEIFYLKLRRLLRLASYLIELIHHHRLFSIHSQFHTLFLHSITCGHVSSMVIASIILYDSEPDTGRSEKRVPPLGYIITILLEHHFTVRGRMRNQLISSHGISTRSFTPAVPVEENDFPTTLALAEYYVL